MKRFLATALLLSSLFSQQIQKESYHYPLSSEAKRLLEQNWVIEDLILNPQKANAQSLLLFSSPETNEQIFFCDNQIIAKGLFDSWDITFTQNPNNFLLTLQTETQYRLLSSKKDFGRGDSILIEKRNQKEFPSILIQSGGSFTLYTRKEKPTLFTAEKARFLPVTGRLPNILFQLSNGQYQLYSNGELSKPFKELLAWNLLETRKQENKLVLLVESRSGKYLSLPEEKNSPIYERPTSSEYMTHNREELFEKENYNENLFNKNDQIVTLYDPKIKEWAFYFRGKIFAGWEEEPLAFSKIPIDSGELAWAGKRQGKWFWFKDNITLAETDFFDFSSSDIQFYQNSFGLIRKVESRYEIYANFESRGSFFIKPSFHLINHQLLEATDNETLFVLYQLPYNKKIKKEEPFDCYLFEEDFFDFWLYEEGSFKAYKEGEVRGEIRSSKASDLMVFLINHSLFFPRWITNAEGETEIYLSGERGNIGPFQSITPLEHPDQKESHSTLFSSLIADTPEGQIALYTDAIIGPADTIFPHFDPQQKGKVLGLKVDFAKNPHYYEKGKGLIPLNLLPTIEEKLEKELSTSLPLYEGPQLVQEKGNPSFRFEETPRFACKKNQQLTFELFPYYLLIRPNIK